MPITVTDEALDALEAASPEEREAFEKDLSDDDFQQIASAIPAWKERKKSKAVAAPVRTPTPGFDLSTEPVQQPAPTPTQPVASPASDPAYQAIKSKMLGFVNPMNALDKLGDAGAYVADKVYAAQDAVGNAIGLPVSPAEDVLRRAVGSALIGEKKAFKSQDEAVTAKGVNDLEASRLGSKGTTAVLSTAQAIGNIPGMVTGFGWADKGAKIGKAALPAKEALGALAGKMAGNAAEGLAMGTVQAGIEGDENPFVRGIAGAAFGAGTTAVGAALGKLAKGVKNTFNIKGPEVKAFFESAAGIPDMRTPEMKAMEGAALPEMGGVPWKPANTSDADFKPSTFVLAKDKAGKDVMRVMDITVGQPVKVAEFDVSTVGGAEKFRNYAEKNRLNGSFGNNMTLDPIRAEAMTPILDMELKVGDTYIRPDGERVVVRPRDVEGTAVKPIADLDAAPVRQDPSDITLVLKDDGHIKTQVTPAEPVTVVSVEDMQASQDFGKAVGAEAGTNVGTPPRAKRAPVEPPVKGYIKDVNGSVTVEKVGADKAIPGNVLVRRNAGSLESVPADSFHPANSPAESLKLVPDAVPLPAEGVKPDVFNAAKSSDFQDLSDAYNVIVRRNPSIWDKLLRSWGGNHLRGTDDLMAKMRQANGLKQVMAVEGDYRRVLKNALKGKPFSEVDVDFEKVARNRMGWDAFKQKHPGVADQVRQFAEPMLKRRDQLHQYFVMKGLVPPESVEMRLGEELEPYLARLYMRNVDPKRYSKLVPSTIIDKAVETLKSRFDKSGDVYAPGQIRAEISKMINAGMTEEAIQSSTLMRTKALDRLRQRKIIPEEIRNLLGEIDSGQVRLAHTLAAQEALFARHQLYDAIAANPAYYSHGPQPHLNPEPIPNDRRAYGELAGGYVSPEIYDFVVMTPKIESQAHDWVRAISRFRKGNLVAWGGFGPMMRSTVGNLASSVWSGGLDLMRPKQTGASMVEAVKALHDFHKDPTGNTGLGKILREMRSYGADWAGIGEEEISGKSKRFIDEMVKEYGKRNKTDAFTFLQKLHNYTYGNYKSVTDKLGNALDLNDRIFRVANYISLKKKYLSNPAKFLPGVEPKDVPRAAAELASKRINQSFMNAPNVGASVKRATQGGVGMFAPFLTSASEEARILAMLPQRMLEEPDLRWRMAQWALLGGAAFGTKVGLQKYMDIGPSDEKVDAALGNMPDRQKFYKPLVTATNMEGDKIAVHDLTQYFLPAQLFRGHPDDSMFANVFANALTFPVEGGGAEGPVRSLLESAGVVRPTAFSPKYLEGDQGITKVINTALGLGLGPRVGVTTQDALRQSGVIGSQGIFEQKMSPEMAIGRALNAPVPRVVDALSPTGQLESVGEINELKRQLKEAGRTGDQRRIRAILDRIGVISTKMNARGQATKQYMESKKK